MTNSDDDIPEGLETAGRVFGSLFALIPLGIGLTVLFFVWSQPTDGFHGVPLFFKVFASFIASGFVLFGLTALFGFNKAPKLARRMKRRRQAKTNSKAAAPGGYACTNCGAPLDADADVSPSGDVKCRYCNTWFNIHA